MRGPHAAGRVGWQPGFDSPCGYEGWVPTRPSLDHVVSAHAQRDQEAQGAEDHQGAPEALR